MTSDMFKLNTPITLPINAQHCPICSVEVPAFPRYPTYICTDCLIIHTPCDDDGNHIDFENTDDYGNGFASIVNGVRGNVHTCWVNGIKCRADSARFGGIVIYAKPSNGP